MRIIAGPCQHESLDQSLEIAGHCKDICDKYEVEYIFKASFDKANRTSLKGVRGRYDNMHDRLYKFLDDMSHIPTKRLTDVHETWQIKEVEKQIDVIQIPAFLCRQTDLIRTACQTDCIINIKKGQFLAPSDVEGILSKTKGAKEVWITERGTSFGYGRLINDFTGMYDLLNGLGENFVYDVTHSVQKPGGQGTSSGGDRRYVPHLARAGAALGITSFFVEVHPDPDNAPSDGPNMLRLDDFEEIVASVTIMNEAVNDINRYSNSG